MTTSLRPFDPRTTHRRSVRPLARLSALLLGSLAAGVVPLHAQLAETPQQPEIDLPDSARVDQIAAIVGDSVILFSELQAELGIAQSQGQPIDPQQMLDQLIEQQLIVQAASLDSTMVITDEQLEPLVEQQLATVRENFGTEQALERAMAERGLTVEAYRDEVRRRLRTAQTRNLFMRRALDSAPLIAISEDEMRDFFEQNRAQLDERPELVTVQQVFIKVVAPDSAWGASYNTADSLRLLIEEGAEFEELAAQHSADPGSAANGGDLGWFRRGNMVREFEDVAFRIRPGTASLPVRTDYGHHIILVERSRPGEVKARHILITPEVTSDDRIVARDRAEEIAVQARAGVDMLELYEEHGDQELPEEFVRPRSDLAEMPYPGYSENLLGFAQGDVIGPFQTQVVSDEYFVVVRIKEIREAGGITFEDVEEQIRRLLLEQKQIQRVIDRLRDQTYIDIRM